MFIEGIDFAAINEHCGLGFEESVAAAVDVKPEPVVVPPPAPPDEPPEPPEKALIFRRYPNLDEATIRWRATKAPQRVQRARRLGKLEAKTKAGWRNVAGDYKAKMVAIVKAAMPDGPDMDAPAKIKRELAKLQKPMGGDLLDVVAPAHADAATEGVVSIQEIVDDKCGPYPEVAKGVTFAPDVKDVIKKRGKYIHDNIPEDLFEDINDAVWSETTNAVASGGTVGEVEAKVKHVMNGFANNAKTIARTEVGTLYNISRFG